MILEEHALAIRRPSAGTLSFLVDQIVEEFLDRCRSKAPHTGSGGRSAICFLGKWMADAPCQLSLSAQVLETSPAEALFDLRWAAAIAGRERCDGCGRNPESKGRRRVYKVLSRYLTAEREDISYQGIFRLHWECRSRR